jgi:two-component system response regulator NreC
LVDDHRLFREGLKSLLVHQGEISVVVEAAEAAEAYDAIDAAQPDVVVVDLQLRGASGITAMREMLRRSPGRRLLALTMYDDEERVAQAIEAGALGYAIKSQPADEVVTAIKTVASGQRYLAPQLSTFVLDDYCRQRRSGQPSAPLRALTSREREVFDLTVRGMSNESIGGQLGISRRTVETHRSRILRKLHASSAVELVRIAAQHGLLPL